MCEHWLKPGEVSHIEQNDFESYWTHLKSSIDPTEVLIGRPYGGCGFVCKKMTGVMYRPIVCESDNLCGIAITLNGGLTISVFGVYMPHNNHSLLNHESYLECLNELLLPATSQPQALLSVLPSFVPPPFPLSPSQVGRFRSTGAVPRVPNAEAEVYTSD